MNKPSNTVQAFWVAAGSLSSFLLTMVVSAILARYLSKNEYGTYRQIVYVYNTLLVIFTAGLPRVFAYFLPRYPLEQGKYIVWNVSKMLLICGLFFSVVLFTLSSPIAYLLNNPELEVGIKFFSPIPMLLLPTLGIEGIFSTYKKTVFIAIYNLSTRIFMLCCIVLPVVMLKVSYLYAIYGWIVSSVLSLILAIYFKGIPFKNITNEKAELSVKKIFSFSLPLVTASLAGMAIKSADQFYISRYFGAVVFAEFSNGFIELPFVSMITGATSTVLMPVFSKSFNEEKSISGVIVIWQNAVNKSALLVYPLVVYFVAYAKEVVVLLYSEKYAVSSIYFQINMFLNFFNIIIFAPLFLSMGKTRLYAMVHIILAVVIWLADYAIVLVYRNPFAIAIFSTSLNITKILFFVYLAARIMKIKYFDLFPIKKLVKYLLHSSVAIYFTNKIIMFLVPIKSIHYKMLFSLMVYVLFLVLTSPIAKINYFTVFIPIVERLKTKK